METRPRTYPARADANVVWIDGKARTRNDPGGQGEEIVREVKLCPACAATVPR
ncbi:MAG: hypothetical protein JST54_11370 [Deltaproteobacteria bacterium]|nr:hypothetical protein [Deltaproteobacteria bacterium]